MNFVLQAKNINKHFHKPKDFHVLKDISFGVKSGEFASIMGKSGSGKSTLLYILSTMDTDYTGQLYLNNQLVTGKSQKELSRIRNKNIGSPNKKLASRPPPKKSADPSGVIGV